MGSNILIAVLSALVFIGGAIFINSIDKRDRKRKEKEEQEQRDAQVTDLH